VLDRGTTAVSPQGVGGARQPQDSVSISACARKSQAPGQALASATPAHPRGPAGAWRVYTDVDWVQDHLIRTDFVHVTDPSSADILWCKASACAIPPFRPISRLPALWMSLMHSSASYDALIRCLVKAGCPLPPAGVP
jgi:hypothetical protein